MTQSYRPNVVSDLSVVLLSANNEALDIKRVMLEFNIYEDMFGGLLKADISIEDTIGILSDLPLVGDEKLIISFRVSEDDDEPIEYKFDVYKVEDRSIIEERSHVYLIHCVSPGFTESLYNRVNGYYNNKTPSDIAQEVYDEYFVPTQAQSSGEIGTIDIEPTVNNISITGSRSNPIEFLYHLATESQSAEFPSSSFYTFYETTSGYHFKSVNKLLTDEVVENFYWADADASEVKSNRSNVKKYQVISSIKFNEQFDRIRDMQLGLYDTTVHYVDPHRKIFATKKYNYVNDFDRLTKINDASFPIIPANSRVANGEGNGRIIYFAADLNIDSNDQTYSDRLTPENDPQKHDTKHRHLYAAEGISMLHSLNQYKVEISIPGNINIKAGSVINIFVPENSDLVENRKLYMKLFGQDEPKFIVTALSHHYKSPDDTYVTFIECSKVMLGEELSGGQTPPKTETTKEPISGEKGIINSTPDAITKPNPLREQTPAEALSEISNLLSGGLDGLVSKLPNLTSLEKAFAGVSGLIDPITGGLKNAITSLKGNLLSSTALGSTISAAGDLLNSAKGALSNITGSLASGFETIQKASGNLLPLLQNPVNAFGQLGTRVFKSSELTAFGSEFKNSLSSLSGVLDSVTGGIGDTLNSVTGGLSDSISQVTGGITSTLSELSSEVTSVVDNTISDTVSSTVNNVRSSLNSAAVNSQANQFLTRKLK